MPNKMPNKMTDKLIIFDTTLRDGEQSPGAGMTREMKIRIARQLEKLGVDVIEAGFAAASPGEFEAVKAGGETLKIALVDHVDVGVEARQAQRGGGTIYKRRKPAPLAKPFQRPFIHDQRRRDTERHHVGQAVVFGAEFALRMRQPRHAAVQPVQHHGDENRHCRKFEAVIH